LYIHTRRKICNVGLLQLVTVSRRQDVMTVVIQEYQSLNVAQMTAAGITRLPVSSGASLEDQVIHLTLLRETQFYNGNRKPGSI